jgi:hypothetical protein
MIVEVSVKQVESMSLKLSQVQLFGSGSAGTLRAWFLRQVQLDYFTLHLDGPRRLTGSNRADHTEYQ